MWYAIPKPQKTQFRIFEGQKLLKPWHKKKTKFGLGGTVGHPALTVWPHTPDNHLVFGGGGHTQSFRTIT